MKNKAWRDEIEREKNPLAFWELHLPHKKIEEFLYVLWQYMHADLPNYELK